jgi:hypothetical protein
MDPSAIHVFFVIAALAGPPQIGDLYEKTFGSMSECAEYVKTPEGKDSIKKSVEEIRPLLSIPDGVPFTVAYGCRGKEKTSI